MLMRIDFPFNLSKRSRNSGRVCSSRLREASAVSKSAAVTISIGLGLNTCMQRDHTAGHIAVAAINEARIIHHLLQGLLIRVHANRLSQIAVTLSIIGYHFAHLWQDVE